MQTIFSTAGVRTAETYDYWLEVARPHLLNGFKGESFVRENFYAELKVGTLAGGVDLATWRSSPGITRSRGTDDLVLALPSSRSIWEISDRCFEMSPNAIYLIDCREPFVSSSIDAPERLQLRVPRDELWQRVSIAGLVNRPIPLRPDTALLIAFVRNLVHTGPSTLSPVARTLVRGMLLDLIAVALRSGEDTLAKPAKTVVPPSSSGAARFGALHAKGLSEREIARRMGLHPIVARAQRRRLGLPPNEGDDRDGALEIGWLALQLRHLQDVRGRQDLVEQLRRVLLLPRREQPDPEHGPRHEGIIDDD